MPKKPSGKKTGRPRIPLITHDISEIGLDGKLPPKPIDFEAVLHWMDLGATAEEIAGSFRVTVDTLNARLVEHTGLRFLDLKEKVCGPAKIALRRNQFNLSKTNATMGIWLGKQWLGQKDDPGLKDSFNGELRKHIESLKKQYSENEDSKEEVDKPLDEESKE